MAEIQIRHPAAETLKWQWRYRTAKGSTGPSIRARGTFIAAATPMAMARS